MGIYNLGGGGGAPELQAKEATPLITNAQQIILPDTEDGYDGLSRVTVNPMPSGTLKTPTVNSIGYVSSGVQTAGYFDTSATSGLQLSTQPAKTITPTTYSQTAVASGKYTTGAVTVAGDANLASNNIIAGKSIFGVEGNRLNLTAINVSNTTTGSLSMSFDIPTGAITSSDYVLINTYYVNGQPLNNQIRSLGMVAFTDIPHVLSTNIDVLVYWYTGSEHIYTSADTTYTFDSTYTKLSIKINSYYSADLTQHFFATGLGIYSANILINHPAS